MPWKQHAVSAGRLDMIANRALEVGSHAFGYAIQSRPSRLPNAALEGNQIVCRIEHQLLFERTRKQVAELVGYVHIAQAVARLAGVSRIADARGCERNILSKLEA